jgi:hypothetical protein
MAPTSPAGTKCTAEQTRAAMFQLDSGHVGGWAHQRYSRALQEYVAYEMLDRRY